MALPDARISPAIVTAGRAPIPPALPAECPGEPARDLHLPQGTLIGRMPAESPPGKNLGILHNQQRAVVDKQQVIARIKSTHERIQYNAGS